MSCILIVEDDADVASLTGDDYIVKPLMETDFLKRVEHILRD